jgi:NAD dependent epimerase/dehydratase
MKILVTGACGFIGSQLAETLVRRGHDVRAMVYYNAFNSFGWLDRSPEVTSMQIIPGDVRDASCVREAMRGCELVYHLAALIGIPYSYRAPESYVQTNVIGTLNVIQAAHELGDIKVVHTSTSEVYGSAQIIPITEQHPLSAQSPYAASKIGADQMALSYYRSFGSPIAIARPFNTFGPRQSNRAVIPTIITQIASGVRRIKLGSTTPTRDFNFVDDTVNGLIAVGESANSIGEVINLGSGYEISVREIAAMIANLMEVDIEIQSEQERMRPNNSEVERLCADASKAQRLLGWAPRNAGGSGLEQALRTTIDWFREPKNVAAYKPGMFAV